MLRTQVCTESEVRHLFIYMVQEWRGSLRDTFSLSFNPHSILVRDIDRPHMAIRMKIRLDDKPLDGHRPG